MRWITKISSIPIMVLYISTYQNYFDNLDIKNKCFVNIFLCYIPNQHMFLFLSVGFQSLAKLCHRSTSGFFKYLIRACNVSNISLFIKDSEKTYENVLAWVNVYWRWCVPKYIFIFFKIVRKYPWVTRIWMSAMPYDRKQFHLRPIY